MLWEELKESLIFLNIEETCNKENILRKMGNALIREGYAKETYTQALIRREEKFPTGLDIQGIGVALPHTDPCHVNKDGIAVAVLERPAVFQHMEDENMQVEVRLVIMLAVLRTEFHLKRLQSVLNIIQDVKILEELLTAADQKEVIQIIRSKEELP